MFKENKEYWFFLFGITIMFFFLFSVLRNGFNSNSLVFSSFPFSLFKSDPLVVEKEIIELDTNIDYIAIIKTNRGDIVIDLFEKNAPNTVGNFISLSNKDFYNGVRFHRFIKDFLLQGGSRNTLNNDPNDDAFGGPGYTIDTEINWDSLDYSQAKRDALTLLGYESKTGIRSVKMGRYSFVMASNNPNTAGSQFFILLADNNDKRIESLEGRHTVFGHVIEGFSIIEEINNNRDSQKEVFEKNDPNILLINTVLIEVKK